MNNDVSIENLLGKTLLEIIKSGNDDEIRFICDDGTEYLMYHSQDCCGYVRVDDIVGDLTDLIGSPILKAEEVTNSEDTFDKADPESFTWTFYHLATINGYVDIKWLGESNGYYSESIYFDQTK